MGQIELKKENNRLDVNYQTSNKILKCVVFKKT